MHGRKIVSVNTFGIKIFQILLCMPAAKILQSDVVNEYNNYVNRKQKNIHLQISHGICKFMEIKNFEWIWGESLLLLTLLLFLNLLPNNCNYQNGYKNTNGRMQWKRKGLTSHSKQARLFYSATLQFKQNFIIKL